jgi:hypothetical protein
MTMPTKRKPDVAEAIVKRIRKLMGLYRHPTTGCETCLNLRAVIREELAKEKR